MRLWHYKLIPVLPNAMLVSQWRECIAIKRQWEKKHLYMYKKYHGSIPKNCNVIFLDGDRDNFSEENLVCIPRQQHRIMAGNNLYFNDKELNNTALMVAELIEKVKEVS